MQEEVLDSMYSYCCYYYLITRVYEFLHLFLIFSCSAVGVISIFFFTFCWLHTSKDTKDAVTFETAFLSGTHQMYGQEHRVKKLIRYPIKKVK